MRAHRNRAPTSDWFQRECGNKD